MLIVSADSDHTVPWAIANASYKKQKRNKGVTEIVKMPGRGHSLTIDAGWREVAQKALEFVKRFAGGSPSRYLALTKETSTTCSATNQTCSSFVRMTSLTIRSLVPSS